MTSSSTPRHRPSDPAVLTFFAAASVLMTWPLGNLLNPTLPALDDAMFSVWRLAWINHQLFADPLRLFDANIFWPDRNTLAFSDAMLLLGVLGTPLLRLGVDPVSVHNILLIAAFTLAGFAAFRLARYFGLGAGAGIVAGCIFAFAPYRIAHIGHLELLWTAFLPLSLLAFYRLLDAPTLSRGAVFGLLVGAQGLCSIYYLVFFAIWMVPVALLAPVHVACTMRRGHAAALLVSVAVAALVLLPYFGPYTRARATLGPRLDSEVLTHSAEPADYLRVSTGHRIYPSQPRDTQTETSLFPGLIALTLTAAGLALERSRAAAVFAALALIAFDLSLGPRGWTYGVVSALWPLVGSFRAPARFGVLVLLAVAVLAAFGVTAIRSRLGPAGQRILVPVLVVLLAIDYWSVPISTRAVPRSPTAFEQWLAKEPRTVVLELPLPLPSALWRFETTYEYSSIFHWQPLVNGYSGYVPKTYNRVLEVMLRYPLRDALEEVQKLGVQLLVLHERFLGTEQFEVLLDACGDAMIFGETLVFEGEGASGGRVAACRMMRPLQPQ